MPSWSTPGRESARLRFAPSNGLALLLAAAGAGALSNGLVLAPNGLALLLAAAAGAGRRAAAAARVERGDPPVVVRLRLGDQAEGAVARDELEGEAALRHDGLDRV